MGIRRLFRSVAANFALMRRGITAYGFSVRHPWGLDAMGFRQACLKQPRVKPERVALNFDQYSAVVWVCRIDQQIQLGWFYKRGHPQAEAGCGRQPGQAQGLCGGFVALPVGWQSPVRSCHQQAVIGQLQLHQGLVFGVGPVAVDALFQLTQGTGRCRIDHLVCAYGMPAAMAQGRSETQRGKNGRGGQCGVFAKSNPPDGGQTTPP